MNEGLGCPRCVRSDPKEDVGWVDSPRQGQNRGSVMPYLVCLHGEWHYSCQTTSLGPCASKSRGSVNQPCRLKLDPKYQFPRSARCALP